jgi:hypothetical protein
MREMREKSGRKVWLCPSTGRASRLVWPNGDGPADRSQPRSTDPFKPYLIFDRQNEEKLRRVF